MRVKLNKRVGLAALFGLLMCAASWLQPHAFLQINLLAYMFAVIVSGNPHQPSAALAFVAVWIQWTAVGYGVSIVFFPRQANDR
jgi:hypothetical protein